MPTVIPLQPGVPDYSMLIDIEDETFALDARWNERAGSFYLDLHDSDGAVVFLGARFVLGAYIGRRANHPLLRSGVFVARDTSGQNRDAGLDDAGTRVQLVFYTNADVFVLAQVFGDAATSRAFTEA